MATYKLTKNYTPRIKFNTDFSIGDKENEQYLNSLAKWHMGGIKQGAKSYNEKHPGTTNNGKKGKDVIVTVEELKELIIEANGISPDGAKIYFAPVGYLNNPGQAMKLGLMTADENSRKPSFDRKNTDETMGSIHYIKNNLQHTTMRYNLGKGSNDLSLTMTQNVKIKVKNSIELNIDDCSPQFLAAYTQSLAN